MTTNLTKRQTLVAKVFADVMRVDPCFALDILDRLPSEYRESEVGNMARQEDRHAWILQYLLDNLID